MSINCCYFSNLDESIIFSYDNSIILHPIYTSDYNLEIKTVSSCDMLTYSPHMNVCAYVLTGSPSTVTLFSMEDDKHCLPHVFSHSVYT